MRPLVVVTGGPRQDRIKSPRCESLSCSIKMQAAVPPGRDSSVCRSIGVCDWNCRDRTGRHAPKRSALGGALSHGPRPPLTAPHMGCEAAADRSPSEQPAGLGLLLLCQHVTAKGARLNDLYSVEFTFSFCEGANEMQFNLGYGVPGVSRLSSPIRSRLDKAEVECIGLYKPAHVGSARLHWRPRLPVVMSTATAITTSATLHHHRSGTKVSSLLSLCSHHHLAHHQLLIHRDGADKP